MNRIRKLLVCLLGVMMMAAVSLGLVGCDWSKFTACDEHIWGKWSVVTQATCTGSGKQVRSCEICAEKEEKVIPAIGHKEVVDAAVAPTCSTTGKTAGKHCSVCGKTTVAQQTIAKLSHTEVIDAAVAPTSSTPT